CGSWSSTDSVFALPDNVNFNAVGAAAGDMSPVVPSGSQSGTGASATASASAQAPQSYYAQQCAACGAISDPTAKAQCIASFDCPSQ
ncbi:MAG TPA: hypothetical protein VN701_00260, partial [Candidatus Paceibacterota bacterium]|nr:hypothetical protein [Candidatus Paceibacterota bacterium]